MNAFWVFLGGGIGALLRYGVSLLVQRFPANVFPLATFISNAVSCLLLGVLVGMMLKQKTGDTTAFYAFWVIGICGGFSTFSTFAKENLELMERGNYFIALLNVTISLALCMFLVYLGRKLT